jgi:carboxymethylenebutenolidase
MTASFIDFRRPDGAFTRAYLAPAASTEAPSVVVLQEWWGLNDQIRSVADRLAEAGFHALVPDLYRGRLAADGEEANHLMSGLDFADATHQDVRGAVAHLAARNGRPVGVMGFCMGGALTVAAAAHVPGLSAAVCFYGVPPASLADPATIAIPFQAHFATRDDWCTPAVAQALEVSMRTAGRQPDVHHYEADHAFFNQTRPEVYDAACADLAWQRTLAFLRQHLA